MAISVWAWKLLIFNLMFILSIFLIHSLHFASSLEWNEAERDIRKNKITDDRPFRMGKINILWEKAKRILRQEDLPKLYGELVVQDRLEGEWKKQKTNGLDEDGEQEALIRRKLLGILNQYGLREIYGEDFGKVQNDVFEKDDPEGLYMQALKKDKRLAKLWKRAETAGFSDDELETLKVEFGHHMQKLDEYEQLKKEVERLDDFSDNTIKRFKTDETDRSQLKEKHASLKEKYRDMKRSFEELEQKADKMRDPTATFDDPRIAELWTLAIKANLSDAELTSFRQELGHFNKKIQKHDYYLKEAEVAKAHFNIQGKNPEKSVNSMYQELEHKVKEHALKVKKWYTELKSRLTNRVEHTEF